MEANQNKAEGFLKQGSILAAASILVRLIGMFYRIPLANIIGDAGNGIYSAAFEVYNILLIISSYGMPMAVSKMVSAKCTKKEYKGAYRVFRYSMVFSIFSGGLMALLCSLEPVGLRELFLKFSGNIYSTACAGTDNFCRSCNGYAAWTVSRKKYNASYGSFTDIRTDCQRSG